MGFDPAVFGLAFHRFVSLEAEKFGFLAPFLHIGALLAILAALVYKNRARRFFTAYFALNWLFLFGWWGVFGVVYWAGIGWQYLLAYLAAPVLLGAIAVCWAAELFRPGLDLDFRKIPKARLLVLPVALWGFWYPPYVYGGGFSFGLSSVFTSYFGLMPCPTTMVVLSLLALSFPRGNRRLFALLSAYALFIGLPTVLTGWLPDLPFPFLGLYGLVLLALDKRRGKILTR